MTIKRFLLNILSKFINLILDRERKVDKQKKDSAAIINGDVTVINIKIEGKQNHF